MPFLTIILNRGNPLFKSFAPECSPSFGVTMLVSAISLCIRASQILSSVIHSVPVYVVSLLGFQQRSSNHSFQNNSMQVSSTSCPVFVKVVPEVSVLHVPSKRSKVGVLFGKKDRLWFDCCHKKGRNVGASRPASRKRGIPFGKVIWSLRSHALTFARMLVSPKKASIIFA